MISKHAWTWIDPQKLRNPLLIFEKFGFDMNQTLDFDLNLWNNMTKSFIMNQMSKEVSWHQRAMNWDMDFNALPKTLNWNELIFDDSDSQSIWI